MDLIIRLIVWIFEEIFEKDRKRRETQRTGGGKPPPGQAQRPGQPGGGGPAAQARQPGSPGGPAPVGQARQPAQPGSQQPTQPPRTLEEWIEGLFGEPKKPSPRPKPVARRTAPPPIPRQSVEDHIRQQDKLRQIRDRKRQSTLSPIEETDLASSSITEPQFRLDDLPGKTPLEQMIFAGVILGPCRAKRSGHRLL